MRVVLWIVGAPGIGKTSLARQLIGPEPILNMKPKWSLSTDGAVAAAGHYSGLAFDGADTVPYNGATAALEYWLRSLSKVALTLFDGDRFSNLGTHQWVRVNAPDARLCCVHLVAAPEVSAARRRIRAAGGRLQNETWIKGRVTKAQRFASAFRAGDERLELDATTTIGLQVDRVDAFVKLRELL